MNPFLILFACGSDPEPEKFTPGEAENNDTFAEEAFTEGRYAMKLSTSELLQDPMGTGDWATVQNVSVKFIDWTRQDTEVQFVEETCYVRVSEVFNAQTEVPQAFLQTTVGRTRLASFDELKVGATFTVPDYYDLNGIRMDDPINDAMPTSVDDPRLYDQDGDGELGITVNVHLGPITGRVYVAQKVQQSMQGVVINQERIEGSSVNINNQFTIGADSALFAGEQNRDFDDDPQLNWFIITKVDDSLECSDMESQEEEIFGR